MNKKYKYLYIVSVLMLLSGAALAMTRHTAFDVLYTLGGVGYTLYYILAPLRDQPRLVRRVARMGVFSGLLFTLSGVARLRTLRCLWTECLARLPSPRTSVYVLWQYPALYRR